MAEETMKDFEKEIEESFANKKQIEDPDAGKWARLEELLENKEVVRVKVIEVVKSGCVAYLEDIRGFIPASHLSLEHVDNLDDFQNKNLDVIVITVDPENKKLVLSHREVERAKRDAAKAEKISQIHAGDMLDGKVEMLKDYGAFVDLGGVSGLLHISQISHNRIKHPGVVLKEGQEIKVKVLDVKDGKISLSMKALIPAPGEFAEDAVDETDGFKYEEKGQATTDLGSLLKGLKLN